VVSSHPPQHLVNVGHFDAHDPADTVHGQDALVVELGHRLVTARKHLGGLFTRNVLWSELRRTTERFDLHSAPPRRLSNAVPRLSGHCGLPAVLSD